MQHKVENKELFTELIIDETPGSNVCIIINEFVDEDITKSKSLYHYLTPKDLSDFIGALLHVQSKNRKSCPKWVNKAKEVQGGER